MSSGDAAVRANFAINTYTVTATAGANGRINPSGTMQVNYGDSIEFSIIPDSTYHISDVVVNGSSVGPVSFYTLRNIAANYSIVVSFTITGYSITAAAGPHGTITPSGSITVNSDSDTIFTIQPDAGYHIDSVVVDGHDVGAVGSYLFPGVMASHTITAYFSVNAFTITVTQRAHGTITPGTRTVNEGENVKFAITAEPGYRIDSVLADGINFGAVTSCPFTNVLASHTLTVYFSLIDGVQDNKIGIPESYALDPNFPNPFNPSTTIQYQLPHVGHVTLVIYDLQGEEVATLANDDEAAGYYSMRWDPVGSGKASGIYFVRLTVMNSVGQSQFSRTHKLLLVR